MSAVAVEHRDLKISILMEDAQGAKEISQSLRSVGIFAHFYSELDQFWVVAAQEMPDLVIIDVTKMSFGATQFKNHPKVKSGELNYAFYSRSETKLLLNSTANLHPVGFLHQDEHLFTQVLTMVEKVRQNIEKNHLIKALEDKVNRLQNRSARMISERSRNDFFKNQYDFVYGFNQELEANLQGGDFLQILMQKIMGWEEISLCGIYSLAPNGQKLLAPQFSRQKYRMLPSLWLGKQCDQGIEDFAAEMAYQVATDLFEGSFKCLRLYGGEVYADSLIFLEVKSGTLEEFPWDLFETLISATYRRFKLLQKRVQKSTQVRTIWEALDRMDQMHYQQLETTDKTVLLSLVPLMNLINRKSHNKFYFSSFFNDFLVELSGLISEGASFSLVGPWHILLFIPAYHLENDFNKVKAFMNKFSYWKYFEDEGKVLGEETKPSLKIIPASAVNYLRILEKEFDHNVVIDSQVIARKMRHSSFDLNS